MGNGLRKPQLFLHILNPFGQRADNIMRARFVIYWLALCAAPALQAQLFSDGFTNSGPLTLPWVAYSNNWTRTGGVLRGGTNAAQTYGFAYITNTWINYSVQARFQFPVGAFGGGLGGRLTSGTGTHYAAWIYPENSPGGS